MSAATRLNNHLMDCAKGLVRMDHSYYESINSFSFEEWLLAFRMRDDLAAILVKIKQGEDTYDWNMAFKIQLNSICTHIAERLLFESIIAPPEKRLPAFCNYSEIIKTLQPMDPVRGLNLYDVDRILECAADENSEFIKGRVKELKDSGVKYRLRQEEKIGAMADLLMFCPNPNVSGPYLYVDLSFDDQGLVEHFKAWLQQTRYEKQVEAEFYASKKKIESRTNALVTYRALQCIDVSLMRAFLSKGRSRNKVAAIVFPDKGEAGYEEGSIRRRLLPKIKHIVSKECFSFL